MTVMHVNLFDWELFLQLVRDENPRWAKSLEKSSFVSEHHSRHGIELLISFPDSEQFHRKIIFGTALKSMHEWANLIVLCKVKLVDVPGPNQSPVPEFKPEEFLNHRPPNDC